MTVHVHVCGDYTTICVRGGYMTVHGLRQHNCTCVEAT